MSIIGLPSGEHDGAPCGEYVTPRRLRRVRLPHEVGVVLAQGLLLREHTEDHVGTGMWESNC